MPSRSIRFISSALLLPALALSIGCTEKPVKKKDRTSSAVTTSAESAPRDPPLTGGTIAVSPGQPLQFPILKEALDAGGDTKKLEGALAKSDAEIARNDAAPDAHYTRGRILAMLGRAEPAMAAHREALRLDPKHAEAHHSLGVLLADKGQDAEAIAHWTTAARSTPPHGDAAFNAGQYHYNRKQFAEALEMWQLAKRAMPDDLGAAKKVVQVFNALGRHDDAEAAKVDLRRVQATSTDPVVQRQKEVVIDQLVVGGRSVHVFEALVPTKPDLHYHWTAVVFDADGKQRAFTVQLETSQYGRETGMPYLDGMTRAGTHRSFGGYKALPRYGEWRAAAVKRIEGELSSP